MTKNSKNISRTFNNNIKVEILLAFCSGIFINPIKMMNMQYGLKNRI